MLKNNERRRPRGPWRARVRTASAVGAVLLAGSVVLTGCGASGEDAGATSESVSQDNAAPNESVVREEAGDQPDATTADGSAPADVSGTADTADAVERHVIRTATLTVQTKDVQDALGEARTAVDTAGGYIEEESTDRDENGEERSRVTFKVPPEEYQDVLDTLGSVGKLLERTASAKDVTGEVVDVESRIKSQQASVSRIRDLMDDATQLSDVVTLESELSTRQADLEALQARLKSLESRSGMATVTLELRTPDAAPVEKDEDETSIGGALSGGWDAFVTMLKWIAIAIGASLPFAATLALLYVAWRAVRRRMPALPRRGPVPPAPVTAPPPVKSSPGETR